MSYKILKNPVGIVEFKLQKNEKITAETGSLVYMQGKISTKTKKRNKGFFNSLKVAFFLKERAFL